MDIKPHVSIVSPVYGCKDCLEALYARVEDAFKGTGIEWELVLVDDRGPDDPWPLISSLAKRDARVHGIRLAKNCGQHLAIWAGLDCTRGKWVAVIDCDLQDDPSIIPDLLQSMMDTEIDAIVVDRGNWSDSWHRRIASHTFYKLVGFLGGIKIDNVGNFGLYSRRMVNTLLKFEEQEVFLPMMIALTGLKRDTYRQDRDRRAVGVSSYSLIRLLRMAVAIIIRFSDRPLKISVILGFGISFFAAVVSLFLVGFWLFGTFTVPGWTSTVLSVWFLSGVIMAFLGIHGFYIGRVFSEVKRRPRYIVEAQTIREVNTSEEIACD